MLIDSNKLILHLNDWAFGIAPTEMTTDKDEYKERATVYKTINECIEVIEMLPSAERKGKWKISNLPKDKILRYCSECGWGINLNDNRKYDYCPNCGARMMKGEQNE